MRIINWLSIAFALVILLNCPNCNAEDYPIDTLVVMFSDSLNQTNQEFAFQVIHEPAGYDYNHPYQMVNVQPQYDSARVKDAFEQFVRWISIDPPEYPYPRQMIRSEMLGGPGDSEGFDSRPGILSLYVTWGFSADLYDIANALYIPNLSYFRYYTLIWNELGKDYFEAIYDELIADSAHVVGIGIATIYLEYSSIQVPEMRELAIDILKAGAVSGYTNQRRETAANIAYAYQKGAYQLKSCIDSLLVDKDPFTRDLIYRTISFEQKNYNQLREFRLQDE